MTLTEKFNAIREAEGPEAAVRAVWKLIDICDGSYKHFKRGTVILQNTNHHQFDFESFDAAADFTAERLRKIEEKKIEITWLEGMQLSWRTHSIYGPAAGRILAILEAQLKELCSGIKVEFLKGETAR